MAGKNEYLTPEYRMMMFGYAYEFQKLIEDQTIWEKIIEAIYEHEKATTANKPKWVTQLNDAFDEADISAPLKDRLKEMFWGLTASGPTGIRW